MKKNGQATLMSPLSQICFICLLFLGISVVSATAGTALATDAESDTEKQKPRSFIPGYMDEPETEPNYELFRSHPERYYPELDLQKAQRLSTFMPGLGQAYAGNYTKATLFLTAELTTFALAGYNIARALHYNEQKGFDTGFQDVRTGKFLTYNQGRTRMKNHAFFSGLFLATGIGIHIWNILDAPKTAEAYNQRRFSLQVQQTDSGLQALVFTHRFR